MRVYDKPEPHIFTKEERREFHNVIQIIQDTCAAYTGDCYDCPFSKVNTARCIFLDNVPKRWEKIWAVHYVPGQ